MERRNFPNRITVELTNACNIDCTFCPRQLVEMKIRFMTEEMYKKIIDEAAFHTPVCVVLFMRGESLLHPQLIPFIRYAKSKGIGPIQLASNGVLLDAEMQEKILDSGLDFISFSLDTNDKKIYECSRRYSDFDRSHNNIVRFLEKCNQYKKEGKQVPETQVSTVDIDEYRAGQNEFIAFWRKYADTVRVYEEHSKDGHLGSVSELHGMQQIRKPCKKLYTDMVVYCDGTVALCNHDWDTKAAIGNIGAFTVAELWNGARYEEIRVMHQTDHICNDLVCKECDHWRMYYSEAGFLGRTYKRK